MFSNRSSESAEVLNRFVAERGVLAADVHFLQKPYSLHALALKVREALGQP